MGKKIAIGIIAIIVGFCGFAALGMALTDRDSSPPVATSKPPVAVGPVKQKAVRSIAGDDIVLIGTDAPAGTYRTSEKIAGLCYWMKSRDAEGSNIIDNDIPSGGRPQVTLKKGEWFTSKGCPEWVLSGS